MTPPPPNCATLRATFHSPPEDPRHEHRQFRSRSHPPPPPPAKRGIINGALVAVFALAGFFAAVPAAAQTITIAVVTDPINIREGEDIRVAFTVTGGNLTAAVNVSWGIAGRIGGIHSPGTNPGSVNDIAAATGTVTLPADYAGATVRLTTAAADGMAEGPEEFDVRVVNAVSAGADTVAPNNVPQAIITIRDPAPVAPADNPTARSARVKAPAAAVARGIGQLAADAIARRVHGSGDGDGRIGLWTGGGVISTDGERDGVEYDGDATAWHIGVDRRLGGGRIGITVAQSGADMDFGADNLDAALTSFHPYFARNFGGKRLWLSIGHGSGDAELTEGNAAPIKTDLSVTTAAIGFAAAPREGVELAATAVHTRAKMDAATSGARRLPSTTADATRLTAAAEFSRELANGARPFLTVSARHDSGDDEQGTAGDLGGGVEWRGPAVHFRLEGATHVGGDGGEEERFGLTLRRAFGPVDLGLNLGLDGAGVDTGRLLTGEWRF